MISYRPLCSNRHRIYVNRIPAARRVTKGIVAFISNEQVFSLIVHFLARARKTEPKEGEGRWTPITGQCVKL